VLAITSPNNAASNGLLRKMGMRFERVVHLVPGDAGSNLYSIDIEQLTECCHTDTNIHRL
jgi:hypothetical protein